VQARVQARRRGTPKRGREQCRVAAAGGKEESPETSKTYAYQSQVQRKRSSQEAAASCEEHKTAFDRNNFVNAPRDSKNRFSIDHHNNEE